MESYSLSEDYSHFCSPEGSLSFINATYSLSEYLTPNLDTTYLDNLLWTQQDQESKIKEEWNTTTTCTELILPSAQTTYLQSPKINGITLQLSESTKSKALPASLPPPLSLPLLSSLFTREEQKHIREIVGIQPAVRVARRSKKNRYEVDMRGYLHLPQKEVASMLNVPSSTLHKRWKKATDKKWPYRFISKLQIKIKTLQENYSITKSPDMKLLIDKSKTILQDELGVEPIWIKTSVIPEN